jgi:hypothetical protein
MAPRCSPPYDLLRVVARLYPQNPPWPFLLFEGVRRVRAGEDANQVRRSVDSTRKRLESLAAADDPVIALFGSDLASAAAEEAVRRPRDMVASFRWASWRSKP